MQNELELKIVSSVTEANQKLDQLISKLNGVEKSASKTINTASKIGKAFNFGTAYVGAKKLFGTLEKFVNTSIDYSESLNLFNVVFENIEKNGTTAFSTLGKEATKFQNQLNEAFGTNQEETLTYQSLFQSMAESMNIASNYSAIMSENSTKLIYDISSLYNSKEKDVAEALRAGIYAGQTKPLRKYGYDVTQQTLQPLLDRFNITNEDGTTKTVKQLSQAEKQILRYIAVLEQSKKAQGDWANTIESPAEQLKIFQNQLKETQRALGNLFVGAFAKMLPWVNGILMVIKEVSNAIANMFGIKISDYNTGITAVEDLSDSYDDVEDSIDGAVAKVKELKREVLSFDQIHNINEDKDSGSGGGSSVSGGIDQRLLDAIHGYDNGMEKVKMKAEEIRDKIMSWLGFTKEVDEETGKVFFKLQDGETRFKKIADIAKLIYENAKYIIGLLVAYKILTKVVEVWKTLKDVKDILGNLSIPGKIFVGAGELLIGFNLIKDSVKSISDEGMNLANSLELALGFMSNIAGGAQIGSIFGTTGAIIGGCAGAILSVVEALKGYKTESEKSLEASKKFKDETQKYCDELDRQYKTIDDNTNKEIELITSHENLLKELQSITDENGKVNDGYEKRADFILGILNEAYGTEYKRVGDNIEKYDELIDTIEEVITKKKLEILLEANKEKYAIAIQNETDPNNKLIESEKKLNDAKKELSSIEKTYYTAKERYNTLTKMGANLTTAEKIELEKLEAVFPGLEEAWKNQSKEIENYENSYTEARNAVDSNTKAIIGYQDMLSASTSDDLEEINNAIDRATNHTYKSLSDELKNTIINRDSMLRTFTDTNGKITASDEERANQQLNTLLKSLNEQSNTIDKLSPEIIDAWSTLAEQSEKDFINNFAKLPSDVQSQIINKMYAKGYSISSELQKGISKITPTVKVKADTSEALTKFNTMLNTMGSKLAGPFGNIFGNIKLNANGGVFANGKWKPIEQYASGGLPSHGSMFIAGEAGAEVVGHINGRTEVLNQSQMASVMFNAVYSAFNSVMKQFGGTNVSLNIRADEGIIVEKAVNGINKIIETTGQNPIEW